MQELAELKEDIHTDLRTQAVVISGEIQNQAGNVSSFLFLFQLHFTCMRNVFNNTVIYMLIFSTSDTAMQELAELKEDIHTDLRTQAVVISGEIQNQAGNMSSYLNYN